MIAPAKPKSVQLREESAARLADARAIKDGADAQGEKLSPEQRTKIDNMLAESRTLLEDAKREEAMQGLGSEIAPEERASRMPEAVVDEDEEQDEEAQEEKRGLALTRKPEYIRAFYRYARYGDEGLSFEDRKFLTEARAEIRTMTEGIDADGGYLAPEQLIAGVQRDALDLEQLAPRMNTINTNARAIRIVRGIDGVQFQWVAELEQKPEDQPHFDRVQIDAHTAAVIVRVSDELLEDSTFGLEAYLSTLAAEAKVEGEEAAFVAGSGTGQPWGLLTRLNGETNTPNRFTTAAVGVLGGDDFMRALYALKPRYRRQATWVLGTQGILAARLLKDTTNNYIWQPGLQAGQPDSILGKPVVEAVHEDLDNPVAGGNDVGFVGDLRRYTVLRRLAMQVKRLEELYAATDEVGFRFRFRTGGDVQTLEAFRSLRVKAA